MNILLVYGGKSCEHDISIITAGLAKKYFDGNIYCCYFDQNNQAYLVDNNLTPQQHKTTKHKSKVVFVVGSSTVRIDKGARHTKLHIDCIVNCCHGGMGEDGILAGMVAMCDIPMVGSGNIASGIAMDKIATKHLLEGAGIAIVAGVGVDRYSYDSGQYVEDIAHLQYPLIVKPATLGSSIGIGIAHDNKELDNALVVALSYDNRVLVEQLVSPMVEYNCSVMRVGGKILSSSIDRPLSSGQILSFADKYLANGKMTHSIVDIDSTLSSCIARLSRRIYRLLGMSGVVRIDYIYVPTASKTTEHVGDSSSVLGEDVVQYNGNSPLSAVYNKAISTEPACPLGMLYVNEINTIPGSLAYSLWQDKFTARQFGMLLVEQAIADSDNYKAISSRYSSNVLDTAKLCSKCGK